jgi:hypothetical protein
LYFQTRAKSHHSQQKGYNTPLVELQNFLNDLVTDSVGIGRPHNHPHTPQPDIRRHSVNNMLQSTLPAYFTPRTCGIAIHNYLFDLNLETGLPTPIGYLDSSAVLSFQWGHYHELSNLYCIANSLAKLHSTPSASYTVITNNEVDNYHHNSQYPSHWTNLSNKGSPPHRERPTTLSSSSLGDTLTSVSFT